MFNATLRALIRSLELQTGARDLPEKAQEPDWTKLKKTEHLRYGAKVRIHWKDRDIGTDYGYVLGLPGYEEDDPELGAIVHIPSPVGGEKSAAEAEWHTLHDLCSNEQVKFVEFLSN
jgi:hypothetical protein